MIRDFIINTFLFLLSIICGFVSFVLFSLFVESIRDYDSYLNLLRKVKLILKSPTFKNETEKLEFFFFIIILLFISFFYILFFITFFNNFNGKNFVKFISFNTFLIKTILKQINTNEKKKKIKINKKLTNNLNAFHLKKNLAFVEKELVKEEKPQQDNLYYFKIFLVVLTLFVVGVIIFSLISQISILDIEVQKLMNSANHLQENQSILKDQLNLKNQQINSLEETISKLQKSSEHLSFKEKQNFEILKDELTKKANTKEKLTQLGTSTALAVGVIMLCKFIKNFFFK